MGNSIVFNNDDQASVKESIIEITNGWFDPNKIYFSMKGRGITGRSKFWGESEYLLESISNELSIAPHNFNRKFKESCQRLDLRLMAYHCTRSGRPEDFINNGILPLNETVLWDFLSELADAFPAFSLSDEDKERVILSITQTDTWIFRQTVTGIGPDFFLSYKEAKRQNHGFLRNGPEIWWTCVDSILQYCSENNIATPTADRNELRAQISQNTIPLVIICSIPFSFLSDDPYYSGCMLKSYFDYLDPGDDFLEGGGVKLKGKKLDPQYIVDIERL